MAARAIGSGTIAFGMVSIPVKLYTAASSSDGVHFNQLHAKCGTRIRQKMYCPKDDETVERDDIVKGYEFAKDKYVTFSPEELSALEAESTGAIEIEQFVPIARVDPVYFDKAYYLGPDKGAARPYRLLAEAMRQTGLSAVARFATRGKDNLVLLRPVDDGIVMQQLHYAYEVRPFADVPVPEAEVKDAELGLATTLIRQISSDQFKPEKFKDQARDRLLEVIQQKIEGKEITAAPAEAPKAQVIDLMAALKASLGAVGVEAADASPAPARKGPKAAGAKNKAPARARKKGGATE